MKKELSNDELYAIIDFTKEDLNSDVVKEAIMAAKRKKVEEQHGYHIWQASDGRWKTYYHTSDGKRKLLAYKEKSDLIDRIMELNYENVENPTLEDLFEEWICEKLEFKEITDQTASRYRQDFKRFFINYEWHTKKILSIDMEELAQFVKHIIINEKLTKKTFGYLRIVLRGIYTQAKKHKYVTCDIRSLIDDMFISKKTFTPIKKDPEHEILNDEEVDKMVKYLSQHKDMMNMAILLDFYTGLRIGELVALKKTDFVDGEYLYVQRTETAVHGKCNEDEESSSTMISNRTKTECGTRKVFLCPEALEIISWLLEHPRNNTEWMFVSNNQNRIVRATLHRRLTEVCDILQIPHKSMHKIRKTYASRLLDSGVNENIICKQLGHKHIDITKNYYYYLHQMKDEQREQLTNAVKDYRSECNQKQSYSKPVFRLVNSDFKRSVGNL